MTNTESYGDALDCALRRIAALEAEVEEQDQLREKLVDLLTRTAAALKGEPEPNTLHSWHDLPELARATTERAQALHAALRAEKVVKVSRPDATVCYSCRQEWPDDAPERHAPGCLAAPQGEP